MMNTTPTTTRVTVEQAVPKLLVLVAVVLFLIAAFGGHIGSLKELDLIALALGIGFASFLL
jgi:hypothetical protein